MRNSCISALVFVSVLILAACGGGDGGSFEPSPPNAGFRVTVTPDSTSIPVHRAETPVYPDDTPFATRVVVSVERSNGSVPGDGQSVTLRASPSSRALIAAPPGTAFEGEAAVEIPPFIPLSSSISRPLSGGKAEFFVHSRGQTGSVTLEASFTASSGGTTQTVRGDATISVVQTSLEPLEAITFSAERTTLPKNTSSSYTPFIGSPFTSSVVVQQRSLDGRFMPTANRDEGDDFTQGTMPLDGVAAISILNDPESDIDEFRTLWGSIAAGRGAAGQSQFFVHALDKAGTAVFSVSYVDPLTNRAIGRSLEFNVIDTASNGLPVDLTLSQDDGGLYVEGSNGRTAKPVNVQLFDGGGERALDPGGPDGSPAFNNVRFEIIDNGGASDARLTANSAHGGSNSGTMVESFTVNGQSNVSVRAGSRTGVLTIRATADAHDNNVENGITDPVTASITVAISDGQLFSLTFTDPGLVTINEIPGQSGDGARDGTYGLHLSVQANDRLGNPVIPGTNVQFGLVDYPLVEGSYPAGGAGVFALSGGDGNPEEAGFTFTAPNGAFINDPDGQVEPGDSILLDGQNVPGNRDADLTLQRIVSSVTGNQSLRVERRFNPNDGTGSMRDSGPVIPYIIGRARHGAIEATAQTDERGVASVKMNYPVSQINRRVAVWAQSEGGTFSVGGSNFTRTVGDITIERYYSAGETFITASPSRIPASGTSLVSICVFDEIGAPIPGALIGFSVSGGSGSVSIDGQVGSGTVANATGFGGCTFTEVTPTGQTPGAGETSIFFTTSGVTEPAEVVVAEISSAILQVTPSAIRGNNSRDVTLRLVDSSGSPLAGVQLTGTCSVSGGEGLAEILTPPGVTDANGETTTRIRTSGMQICGSPPSGSCEFTTASGSPTGTLTLLGVNLEGANFSPGGDPCDP